MAVQYLYCCSTRALIMLWYLNMPLKKSFDTENMHFKMASLQNEKIGLGVVPCLSITLIILVYVLL